MNYPRNVWHGVLTPIGEDQDFLVVDRGGDGNNLEEHFFDEPYEIHLPVEDMSMADAALIDRLFDVIENDIVPLTADGVAHGNKLFGAAILRKIRPFAGAGRNQQRGRKPALAWRGPLPEALLRNAEGRARRHQDCIFLATHEPCSLCLSAITWTGFDNFYYLFSHEDSRDSFAIPHDLKILKEVFTLDPGGYNAENAYWKSFSLRRLVRALPEAERPGLEARIAQISRAL